MSKITDTITIGMDPELLHEVRTLRLRDFVRDENGKLSSTRVILAIAISLFSMITITDTYWDVEVNQMVYEIIKTTLAFGLGGQAIRTTVSNMRTTES